MGFLTPNASGEQEVLVTYALQQLAQLRSTVYGLTDEQFHSTPSASSLSLAALLRHGGQVAVEWSAMALAAPEAAHVVGYDDSIEDCQAHPAGLTEALEYFDDCVDQAQANLRAVSDLAAPVPVPQAPWFPPELKSWEARWAIAHIATEVARHTGHADIIRETIDGKTSYELNERADGQLADDEEYQAWG